MGEIDKLEKRMVKEERDRAAKFKQMIKRDGLFLATKTMASCDDMNKKKKVRDDSELSSERDKKLQKFINGHQRTYKNNKKYKKTNHGHNDKDEKSGRHEKKTDGKRNAYKHRSLK